MLRVTSQEIIILNRISMYLRKQLIYKKWKRIMDLELSLIGIWSVYPGHPICIYNFPCAYWVFCCKRLVSELILMTYEVKPNDQAASRPLMAALRSSTRDVYTTAYVHLVLRCRGKSNNFTLGELAIARFRLVCLSHIARITLAPLRTKSNMGIEGRGKIRDPTFRDYRSLSSSVRINR